jgi:hypothetical protein
MIRFCRNLGANRRLRLLLEADLSPDRKAHFVPVGYGTKVIPSTRELEGSGVSLLHIIITLDAPL